MFRLMKRLFDDVSGSLTFWPHIIACVLSILVSSLLLHPKTMYEYSTIVATGFLALLSIPLILILLFFIYDKYRHGLYRKKLKKHINNNNYKIIKKTTKEEISKSEIEALLKRTSLVETSKFVYSNIDYPFVEGYRLILKDKEYPFNVVVLQRESK